MSIERISLDRDPMQAETELITLPNVQLPVSALFECVPDAIVVVDESGHIVLANGAATELFAYTDAELIGQSVECLIPDRLRTAHTLHRQEYLQKPESRPMGLGRHLRAQRKDGSEFAVEISLSPLQVGTRTYVVSALRYEAPRESEERYRLLTDQSVDGVFLSDSIGRYLDVNPAGCQMFGYTRDEILNRTIADMIAPDEIPKIVPHVAEFAGGRVTRSEWHFRRKDGSVFIGEVVGRQLPDGRLQAILRDMTEQREAQEALRTSEERLRGIYEYAPTGIALTDLDGKFEQCNPAYARMLGYSESELRQIVFSSLVHPDDREANMAEFRRLLAGDTPFFEIENRYVRKGGDPVWVHKFISLLRDASGAPTHITALVTDITGRKRAEQERALLFQEQAARAHAESMALGARYLAQASRDLAESLDYEATIDTVIRVGAGHLADICAVDLVEENGAVRRVAVYHRDPEINEAIRELTDRYRPGDAADHPSLDVIRSARAQVYAEVTDALLASWSRDDRQLQLVRKIGMRSVMLLPLRARNRVLGSLVLARTSSERPYGDAELTLGEELAERAALAIDNARLYQAKEAAEARFQGLFEGSIDGLLVVDPDGRYLDANPAMCELTGYSRDELREMQTGDLTTQGREAYSALLRGEAWPRETELHRRDGSSVPVEVRGGLVQLRTGPVSLLSFRDITERRALERLQQDFLAMVSHELRNPLAALLGWTEVLQRGTKNPQRALAIVAKEVRELDRLIGDVLDAARVGADHLTLERSRENVGEIVREVVEAYATAELHRFELEIPEMPVYGDWDRGRVAQITRNLISNAIKYSPDGGVVRVRLTDLGDDVEVTVCDEGIGIAPEVLPRLFGRFYRAEQAKKDRLPGLGLGLYITKSLVEAHGGHIRVTSEGPGKGSCFAFTLPYAET
jgi:PAS domain S-box-containing protein